MENNNSCCFVARINEIKPIEGADKIEQAIVAGWSCIVPKGLYEPNSLVIIATTDAVIPVQLSDSIEVTNYLRNGQRVRTVKLRGVYSECLIIPVEKSGLLPSEITEGKDMMDVMHIYKYEPPVKTIQLASGRKIRWQDNSNFHVYYKFPNLKNVPGMFTGDDIVEITRKIHGTNARYGIVRESKLTLWDKVKMWFGNKWAAYDFIMGSHNVEKGSDSQGYYDTNVWREIADKYDIKEKLWEQLRRITNGNDPKDVIGSGYTIYGEIYGPGIQKGYDYGLKEIQFLMFDLTINGEYQGYGIPETAAVCMSLPFAEVLYRGPWSQEIQDKYVFNNFIEGTKVPHEGIVIKHISGDRSKVGKAINPDYLIFAEKHDVGDSH